MYALVTCIPWCAPQTPIIYDYPFNLDIYLPVEEVVGVVALVVGFVMVVMVVVMVVVVFVLTSFPSFSVCATIRITQR